MVLCRKYRPVRLHFGPQTSQVQPATCGQQANIVNQHNQHYHSHYLRNSRHCHNRQRQTPTAGGFLGFSANQPQYCESKSAEPDCQPDRVSGDLNQSGPTQVLHFLYVGSQSDALDAEAVKKHGITHVLNVSNNCPQSGHVLDENFLRIAVNDGYVDKLLPHFNKAFQFIENVRASSGRCLVHCLAGISRSPTLAIAYIMKYKKMSHEEAYRFVKQRRTSISPNFNFLGQLVEYEKQLRADQEVADSKEERLEDDEEDGGHAKRQKTSDCHQQQRHHHHHHLHHHQHQHQHQQLLLPLGQLAQSPTTALSRLSFTPCSAGGGVVVGGHAQQPQASSALAEFNGSRLDQVTVTPCLAASGVRQNGGGAGGVRRLAMAAHRPRSAILLTDVAASASSSASASASSASWRPARSRSEHHLQQHQADVKSHLPASESMDSVKSGSSGSQELLTCS